jgi:hypothetical protein
MSHDVYEQNERSDIYVWRKQQFLTEISTGYMLAENDRELHETPTLIS